MTRTTKGKKAKKGTSNAQTTKDNPLEKAEKATSKHRKENITNHEKNKAKNDTTTKKERWAKVKGKKVKPLPAQKTVQKSEETYQQEHEIMIKQHQDDEPGPALDIVADRFQRKKGIRRLRKLSQKVEGAKKIRFIAEATLFTESVVIVDDPSPTSRVLDHRQNEEDGLQVVTTLAPTPLSSIKPCAARVFVKPLIILDVNGILCHRIRDDENYLPPHVYRQSFNEPISGTKIIPRPYLTDFLNQIFEHFCVAIWTSATEQTAKELVKSLIPDHQQNRLLFVWHQDDCQGKFAKNRDTGRKEAIFCKNILMVWEAFPLWNVHNTLLIDDSPVKSTHATRMNVVNPPSLNGRTILQFGSETTPVLDDHVNVEKQSTFFAALADLWKTTCTVEHWVSEMDLTVSLRSGELHDFLRGQSNEGHMAWSAGYYLGCDDYEDGRDIRSEALNYLSMLKDEHTIDATY